MLDHLKGTVALDFSDSPRKRSIFESLIEEHQETGAGRTGMMHALMNQCLIHVLRRLGKESDGSLPWLTALDDPRMVHIIETILKYPGQPYTLELLANIANMSRSTFVRHFEQNFGRTPNGLPARSQAEACHPAAP